MEHQGGIFMTKCICNKLKQNNDVICMFGIPVYLTHVWKNCISRTNYRWL